MGTSPWRDMRRFSTGGTYVNFLAEEETTDCVAATCGRNLARLTEVPEGPGSSGRGSRR